MAKSTKEKKRDLPPVKCGSLDDVNELLGELSAMTARRKSLEADLATRLKDLVDGTQTALSVVIAGNRIAFADRAKSILSALETYCAANKRTLLEEGSKSREFQNGTVGWEKSHDKIDPTKSKEKKGNPDILEAVILHLRAQLATFDSVSAALADCLSIDADWKKTDLKTGLGEGKFTAEEVRSIGFKLTAGADEFFVRPAEVTLESLPRQ